MVTQTPRLKLNVDTDNSSSIDNLSGNWSRVDEAAGVISTVKGVDIPNNVLFNGARCVETDTGISWIAKDNGSGGFNKQYVNYPFTYCAFYNAGISPMNAPWGFDTFVAADSINSSWLANNEPGTNRFKATVKGLYTIMIHAAFAANAVGQRELDACINGTQEFQAGCERLEANPAPYGTNVQIEFERILNIGDTVTGWINTNQSSATNLYFVIFVTLIRPLP